MTESPQLPQGVASTRRRLAPHVRRVLILEAAEEVFARQGYQGTAMEDIAVAAGTSRALVYAYFKDRGDLYLQCIQRARTELEASLLTAAHAETGARARLQAAFTAYFQFVQDRGRRWDVLFGGGASVTGDVAEQVVAGRFKAADTVRDLLLELLPTMQIDQASATAHVLSGAAEQLAKWWRQNPHVPIDDVVAYVMVVWTGLAARADPD